MDFSDLSDAGLEKTIAATSSPLLISFRTNGNKRCKDVEDWLIKQRYKEKLRLGRIDVDKYPETRTRFSILGLPNLVLFKGSVERRTGWIGPWLEESLQEFLKPYL